MGAHVPLLPPVLAAEHARQLPVQVVLQQTPSMQLPLEHSFGNAQAMPSAFFGVQVVTAQ
jgi:hypothetical protein